MVSGSDSMGAPSSFTARRPNASNLPTFELPPPQLSALHQKYQTPYPNTSQLPTSSAPASLTSVGNLLTPPSNVSGDGLSPISGITSGSSAPSVIQPYTPNGYMWPPPSSGTTPYGFPSNNTGAFRGLFSPSLNSLVKGTNSPSANEGLPPPQYSSESSSYSTSLPMSAPGSLPPAYATQQSYGSAPVTQPSPVNAQEAFARPPPTPSYSYSSTSSNPQQQSSYTTPYSSGPSPIHHSPLSAGGAMSRASPINSHGQIPPLQSQTHQSPYSQHRPYSYPLPGPVLSNVNNPNGQLGLVGNLPLMMPSYNSGHAAQMHMYAHPAAQASPANDRPFKCDQCPQSFNRNHDLKRHKRIHLAVKPFPCGHCDKSFSRKDALKRHILVKGCGKAQADPESETAEHGERSISPDAPKSETTLDTSPVVTASA
ncbi:hypothetical protein M8818_003058 [Zalaria obscura]|uniref:Uncharacterized protein n=1 Tax=Zalaria obscura TaxID=2024903 RepID=A0ACC3SHT1_9PEZI